MNTKPRFIQALLLAFIVLKLCKVIDWSWWWVLSPFWIGVILMVAANFMIELGKRLKQPRTDREKAADACDRIAEYYKNRN